MNKLLENQEKCTGCMACLNSCPKKAIKSVENDKGFLYPYIDEKKCINCEICNKVCPIINKVKSNGIQQAYAVVHNDEEVLYKSSSGGAFTALSEYILENERNSIWGTIC